MMSLYPAMLLKRYKRFLADIRLADGSEFTVHCPNTGSMRCCVVPNSPCWYSVSENKARKYPQTLEIVTTSTGHLAGINTGRANLLVARALQDELITELRGYASLRREVRYGSEKSRIDFLLEQHAQDERACYLEVKNVTLLERETLGYFPDAISVRGSKHLRELITMVQQGHRAVLLFCVQHSGIETVSPADHIDSVYGEFLRAAIRAGVEVIAYGTDLNPSLGIMQLRHPLRVVC